MNVFTYVHTDILLHVYVFMLFQWCAGNCESSKQCHMAASTEVSTAAPVGGAMPSASTKEYLTDEELDCDESQPAVVRIY